MRGLEIKLASTYQAENPRGFSEVGENKQLLIAIVVCSFFYFSRFLISIRWCKILTISTISFSTFL
ncbi:MAG: hypothetical protein CMC76_12580 [Flavobacteriaceae bacterium]|nr:hypothetical protein [Flavobacteriaceae bacterium]